MIGIHQLIHLALEIWRSPTILRDTTQGIVGKALDPLQQTITQAMLIVSVGPGTQLPIILESRQSMLVEL
jgi:hypothetical protein